MIHDNNEDIIVNEKTSLLNNDESLNDNNKNYNSIDFAICGGYENNNSSKNKLIKVVCVSTLFFLLELTGGIISGSLALLSDSFHLLSDVVGFLISLIAVLVSQRKATKKYSFGYHRAEIIGALLSLLFIWILTIGLVIGAIDRLRNPVEINAKIMLITAIAGVCINIILAFTLHGDHDHAHGHAHSHSHTHAHIQSHNHNHQNPLPSSSNTIEVSTSCDHEHQTNGESNGNGLMENYKKENINVKAAIIHIVGDLISSIGVVIAATIIYFDPSKVYIDPICTFIFSIIVIFTTINLLKQTLEVIMESTPEHIDSDEVIKDLIKISGIVDIHDLHIWNITLGKPAIAAHISVKNEGLNVEEYQRILNNAQFILCTKFGIHHTTLQIEYMDDGSQYNSEKSDHLSVGSSENPDSPSSSHQRSPTHNSQENGDVLINITPSTQNYRNYSAIHCKSKLCC